MFCRVFEQPVCSAPTLKAARSNRVRHAKTKDPHRGSFVLRTLACWFERSSHTGRLSRPVPGFLPCFSLFKGIPYRGVLPRQNAVQPPGKARRCDVRHARKAPKYYIFGAFVLSVRSCLKLPIPSRWRMHILTCIYARIYIDFHSKAGFDCILTALFVK